MSGLQPLRTRDQRQKILDLLTPLSRTHWVVPKTSFNLPNWDGRLALLVHRLNVPVTRYRGFLALLLRETRTPPVERGGGRKTSVNRGSYSNLPNR